MAKEVEAAIGGEEVHDLSKFWDKVLESRGCKPIFIHLPELEYYAFEYGYALPDTNESKKMIRESIKKVHPDYSSGKIESEVSKAYKQYIKPRIPRGGEGIAEIIRRSLTQLEKDRIPKTDQVISQIAKELSRTLSKYEQDGVCTLALAYKIYINTTEEENNGKNEHETVQSLASGVRSSQ